MVLDTLDGRLARLTHTTSEFGSHYDSLVDMVSFGVAPALVIYEWSLGGLGKIGSLAAFIYMATAALRLARFNVQSVVTNKDFIGLPSPCAAGLIGSTVWLGIDNSIDASQWAIPVCVLTVLIGMAMVSNFSYWSFKHLDSEGPGAFRRLDCAGANYRSGERGSADRLVCRGFHVRRQRSADLDIPAPPQTGNGLNCTHCRFHSFNPMLLSLAL